MPSLREKLELVGKAGEAVEEEGSKMQRDANSACTGSAKILQMKICR